MTDNQIVALIMAVHDLKRDEYGYTVESLRQFWGTLGWPNPDLVKELIYIADRARPAGGPI